MTVAELYEYCKKVGAENCVIRIDTVQNENNYVYYPNTTDLSFFYMKECILDAWSPEEEKKLNYYMKRMGYPERKNSKSC